MSSIKVTDEMIEAAIIADCRFMWREDAGEHRFNPDDPQGLSWRDYENEEGENEKYIANTQAQLEAALSLVEQPEISVQTMRTSAGADYYVHIKVGTRTITPHKYRIEGRALFDVAYWKWVFGQAEKPHVLDYNTDIPEMPAENKYEQAIRGLVDALHRTKSQLGEGIHASLRRFGESYPARTAWGSINKIPAKEWSLVIYSTIEGLGINDALAAAKLAGLPGTEDRG